MKKSGKCQTKRDRPVYSRIATSSHARRKPIGPMARIQGISKSPSCISAWFIGNKDIKERGRGANRIAIPTTVPTLLASSRWNLPEEIGLCEIDQLVAEATDNGLEHEDAEAWGLFRSDCWRHRKFLSCTGSSLDHRQKIATARKLSRTPSNGLETANQNEKRKPDS